MRYHCCDLCIVTLPFHFGCNVKVSLLIHEVCLVVCVHRTISDDVKLSNCPDKTSVFLSQDWETSGSGTKTDSVPFFSFSFVFFCCLALIVLIIHITCKVLVDL